MLRAPETETNESLMDQLKAVLRDGVDYGVSQLAYLQAKAAALAMSSLLFAILIGASVLLGIAAFVLLNVATGFWLTQLTGHAAWALLILGGAYLLLGGICAGIALRWLKQLQS